jgi:diguanylate cyclase (GGDEF)-like protein
MPDETLLAQILENPDLPSPPGLALQVCEKASHPDCSLREISEMIRLDPALCGKLLKTVNSALFSPPRPVTSIDRALSVLGLRAVRSLVLSLSLPALQSRKTATAFMTSYWASSVAGAIIARELAVKMRRGDPDDDMVAGLLRDLGVLILNQVYPEEYEKVLTRPAGEWVSRQCGLEEQLVGITHAEVSAALLRRWGLPEHLTEAIRHHHQPDRAAIAGPAIAERAQLLYFASQVAQLQLAPAPPETAREIVDLARDRFGMNEQELGDFLEPLTAKINAFASLLNVDIGRCDNFTVILARSIEELVKLTIQTTRDQNRAEEEKKEAKQQAQQWRRTAMKLRREAVRDPLTGIFARGFFEETLRLEFRRAARRSSVLGLLFIDLDGFKECNDGYGHLFGDQVLREVAARLRRETPDGEIVARYGGDEFCVVAVDTSLDGLQALANRLRQALNPLPVRRGNQVVQIGASIGGAVSYPRRPGQTYQDLLASADKAMYEAKDADHKLIPILSLMTDEDTLLIEAVNRRLFSTFLREKGKATEDQVRTALRKQTMPTYSVGRVARQLGWLSPGQLRSILALQRRTRSLFGEIAVAERCITQDQMYWLLAIQRERPEMVADSLVDHDILTEQEAAKTLTAYYQTMPGAKALTDNSFLQTETRRQQLKQKGSCVC